ncbi:MAG: alpha-2-macroglobulin family protein [Cocleimonas sp.]
MEKVIRSTGLTFLLFLFIGTFQVSHAESLWQPVSKLLNEQKLNKAIEKIDTLLKQEKSAGHNKNWRQAIVLGTEIRTQQNNVEDAVNYILGQDWPKDKDSTLILNLHLAKALMAYVNRFNWKIQNRENIKSSKPLSLKKKSMGQLNTDINTAFTLAYKLALKDSKRPLSFYKVEGFKGSESYFSKENYPPEVRGSIVDTVIYLWVDYLRQSQFWSAEHSNQSAKLSMKKLLSSSYQVDHSDSSVHPEKRSASLLSLLEQREIKANRPEAAMEAFRQKVILLDARKRSSEDTDLFISTLRKRIEQSEQSLSWVNALRSSLADILKDRVSDTENNIKSIAVLKECLSQHKKIPVTQFCKHQHKEITKPVLSINSMKVDGLNKRSILLEHKNIDTLYFRAWSLNVKQALSQDMQTDARNLITSKKKPAIQWQQKITRGKDYKSHKTYITPPIQQHGYWLIAASLKPDFSIKDKNNVIVSTTLSLSRLVADRVASGGELNLSVFNGETGHVAPKTNIQLWQVNYGQTAKFIASTLTANDGTAKLTTVNSKTYKLVLKRGNDFTISDQFYSGYSWDHDNALLKNALIFTDRAIYRPGQKILWKIIAYKGDSKTENYTVFPQTNGFVELKDANGKVVKKIKVKTNQYGSASGEFIAKEGLLLGRWSLSSAWNNRGKTIRVEEYKRPTFKANFEETKKILRLGEKATITGSAKYYFGQAVTEGKVKWSVKRSAIYPWEHGSSGGHVTPEKHVANGTQQLDEKGLFNIVFEPEAAVFPEEGKPSKTLVYSFVINAEITDSGGETRHLNKTFKIAKSSIKVQISQDHSYVLAAKSFDLSLQRYDLNDVPRAGVANWTLHQISQPKTPIMPADKMIRISEAISKYATKGDRLSPRWSSSDDENSHIKQWKNAQIISKGSLNHAKNGSAKVTLQGLRTGLYRFKYISKDSAGNHYSQDEIIRVANTKQTTMMLPTVLEVRNISVEVDDKVQILVGSGFKQSPVTLEVYQRNKLLKRRLLRGGIKQIEFPVQREHRGGLRFMLTMIKDYQIFRKQVFVNVPWTDRHLNVSFTTFRDKLQPGQKETWRVSVKDANNKPLEKGAVEVLASMYDRSLDLFAAHYPATIQSLYSDWFNGISQQSSLGVQGAVYNKAIQLPDEPSLFSEVNLNNVWQMVGIKLIAPPNIVHPSPMAAPRRAPVRRMALAANVHALQRKLKSADYYNGPIEGVVSEGTRSALKKFMNRGNGDNGGDSSSGDDLDSIETRTNFNETAFFYPHLVLENDGSVAFEFEVPESLTQWKFWVSAISKDLRGGTESEFVTTSKELMVRPYLPRFLRAGDHAEIEVLVNNNSDKTLTGKLDFDVLDEKTKESIADSFKLENTLRDFTVSAGQSTNLRFSITAPKDLGMVAIRARASASNGTTKFGDGEQRPLPVLPSRFNLSQSRFTALKANTTKKLEFKELAQNDDTTRINESLVVTIDGQLFYSTLNALPYLTEYPYECTEQTMNRFLSTSIISSVFSKHPALASMANKMKQRKSKNENWDTVDKDPNSKMLLEETPWLNQSKGGNDDDKLLRILDPKVANAQHKKALLKLRKAQTAKGGFPWWEGGPDSPYMTAYLLRGFSRALEFNVDIPKDMVQKAWGYLHKQHEKKLPDSLDEHVNEITFVNYVLSSYPDKSWTGKVFSEKESAQMLNVSYRHWKTMPPLLRAFLSLTLHRAGEKDKAKLIFDSVMDAAITDEALGTYWKKQQRSWLWYNDEQETHAFMLRTMLELNPEDERRHGLVQWIMLNKKLNHWKSTRATAENIYSLVHYLQKDGQLGKDEKALIKVGKSLEKILLFKVNEYTGAKNQLQVKVEKIKPEMANIIVENKSKSLMFASASWHFSTDTLPKEAQGDFFKVSRKFFRRIRKGRDWELQPLAEGVSIKVGDQLEVQLNLFAKHTAEYVHLRAPRGAGFEPEDNTSGYRWKNRASYYEEIRDSGTNFFFERLPAGEYRFKYRLRATTAGQFRVAPATVQSIYAPEFNAYSSGKKLGIAF